MAPTAGAEHVLDRDEMDPGVRALLRRKAEKVAAHATYSPIDTADVENLLRDFFADESPRSTVRDVQRMGGGASKEQFLFSLDDAPYVLRLDPIETAAETDRRREFEVLNTYSTWVPAPRAIWLDESGSRLGQPAMIMNFVAGVTKPTAPATGPNVTGLGTSFPQDLRAKLAPQFVHTLADLHRVDWRELDLPSFHAPAPGTTQAALWQVNWMSRVWRDDHVQDSPVVAVVDRWLRRHLPVCESPVMVHGDYRTGNFLFDESTGRITAILDWEWAHLGDHHEDLGWMTQRLYMTHQGGTDLVCGLLERDELIEAYERDSGRKVDRATLRWYEIYNAYKSMAITLATSVKAARDGANHQDALLSWLGPAGYRFATELCAMLEEEG
ncbi:phosphotransferase family protein [Saccharopolyspora sp. HNM0986]|uniref:phosphotransferase family protein n=1 Tax=Saccharopolyspora galaxeae TaxID=2781241 RepID=UPI00190A612C|nr:phosphotransferase family protein [Saccharopolyspora sp. HNM0986]MBK0870345.1 phosphotransferase family protein [Saccharopolyspora sp. HNM0986]